MFAEPTIEDYSDRFEWLLDKHRSLTAAAVSQIEREASAKGRYQSSSTIVGIFDAVDTQLNVAVDAALGELSRAARISDLDETRLRELTHERLRAFATQMKSAAKPDKLRTLGGTNSVIDDRLSGIDTALAFKLRQFDVGFLVPEEPEMRPPEEPAAVVDTASGNGGSGNRPGGLRGQVRGTCRRRSACYVPDLRAQAERLVPVPRCFTNLAAPDRSPRRRLRFFRLVRQGDDYCRER